MFAYEIFAEFIFAILAHIGKNNFRKIMMNYAIRKN